MDINIVKRVDIIMSTGELSIIESALCMYMQDKDYSEQERKKASRLYNEICESRKQ